MAISYHRIDRQTSNDMKTEYRIQTIYSILLVVATRNKGNGNPDPRSSSSRRWRRTSCGSSRLWISTMLCWTMGGLPLFLNAKMRTVKLMKTCMRSTWQSCRTLKLLNETISFPLAPPAAAAVLVVVPPHPRRLLLWGGGVHQLPSVKRSHAKVFVLTILQTMEPSNISNQLKQCGTMLMYERRIVWQKIRS